jgi:acyl-CoA thioesterase I
MNTRKGGWSILTPMLKIIGLVLLAFVVMVGIQLLLMLKNVSSYNKFWQETARQKKPDNAQVLVVLGDSAAQSIGASSPMKGYVGLVAKDLEARQGRAVHIVNLSVTGASVKSVIDNQVPQLKLIDKLNEAIVIVDIGANDITRNVVSKEEFENQLDELLRALPKHTILADLPSFARTRFSSMESRIKEFNPIVYMVAERYGIQVAPLYDATVQDKSLLTNSYDLFHPSDRGYRNWAKAFLEVL